MIRDEKLRVLFVDDEQRILDGLRRQFRGKRDQWDIRFAQSGEQALRLMEEVSADVVISDMRMPGMHGAALLREVQERWPGAVRFVLSAQTDQADLLRDVGAIHQFIQKPCAAEALERAVTRTCDLASTIESEELRSVTARIGSLPVVSDSFTKLVQVLEEEKSDANTVAEVVERDVGLSAKLLQMVNSAFFGIPRHVHTVKDAVVLLGTSSLKSLAIASQIIDALASGSSTERDIARLWRASADIGALAGTLARNHGQCSDVCDTARLAGTLSLIGRGILLDSWPGRYAAALERAQHKPGMLHEAEAIEFGVPQHSVGAYALGLWAFDDEVIEAVAGQVNPDLSLVRDASHPLPYVHAARSTYRHAPLVEAIEPASSWLKRVGVNLPPDSHREAA